MKIRAICFAGFSLIVYSIALGPPSPELPKPSPPKIPAAPAAIGAAPTSIAAFVGWTQSGPVDQSIMVQNWPQFTSQFGQLHAASLVSYSVREFFNNGGTQAYILRLAGSGGEVLAPNTAEFENALFPSAREASRPAGGGIRLLDKADIINLLCVPGACKPAIVAKLESYCSTRRAMLLVDCDTTATVAGLKNGPDAAIRGADGANGAFFFPWCLIADSLSPVNKPIALPPCGFIAGVLASTDLNAGVWKSPGAELADVTAPAVAIANASEAMLLDARVNCIRALPGRGVRLYGWRTLSEDDQWRYISTRRTAMFIEESVARGTRWTASKRNAEPTWAMVRTNVGEFLNGLWRQGALLGAKPEDAYFVKCGHDTMTEADLTAGRLDILIGVALVKPAEFITLRIQGQAASQPDGPGK